MEGGGEGGNERRKRGRGGTKWGSDERLGVKGNEETRVTGRR